MSRENQVELMDRMAMVEVNLPQVFVNGQYLGVRTYLLYYLHIAPMYLNDFSVLEFQAKFYRLCIPT